VGERPGGALIHAARAAGWSSTTLGKAASPEKVSSLLASLSPEERAQVLASYMPKKGGK
jgi:hypothetical protein